MNYTIGTGYFDNGSTSAEFFKTWIANTRKYAKPANGEIVVVNAASPSLEKFGGTWLNMRCNYGHVKTMSPEEKYGGWWLGFMTGALVAFQHGTDFIYKEQDCLAFGSWVEHMYAESRQTGAGVIVGKFDHKYKIEQSLVLVKRGSIMGLIQRYLAISGSDIHPRPELKFLQIMKRYPRALAFMQMGCGRNRPIPYDAPCFYAQKLTQGEMQQFKSRGLL